MTAKEHDLPQQDLAEKAYAEIQGAELARISGAARQAAFGKLWRQLSPDARKLVCERSALLLKERHSSGERLDGVLFALSSGFASERDWESAHHLLQAMARTTGEAEFFREVALILLELTDFDLSEKHGKVPLGQTTLVLLTELGMLLANQSGQSSLDYQGTSRVVEFITTSLLARSNVNNAAMRISLVHYLSKCPMNSQATLQLNRVISRFGQSLLDDLLKAFFEDKKRANAAFFFLVEHLNSFFSASPALAEMSHNVLKHYMLKHPAEFPMFLASYADQVAREDASLRMATRHMALLLRAAIDVAQKPLAEALVRALGKHLAVFRDVSEEAFNEQFEGVAQIAFSGAAALPAGAATGAARGPRGGSQLSEDLFRNLAQLLSVDRSEAGRNGKVMLFANKLKKPKDLGVKLAKVGEKPSPLEQMLSLAC